MNNLSLKIKKILSNKNAVTALGFLLIGIIIIFSYNFRLKSATSPIEVPYALVTIEPQTQITADMIGKLSIARDAVNKEYMHIDASEIINRYTNIESTIQKGSFFYRGAVAEKNQLPNTALFDVPDGYTILILPVDMYKSYFNSLVPGGYFDLYVKTIGTLVDEKKKDDEIIVGKLIDKIKILAVKTAEGKNAISGEETRTPAGILFAVPEEQALLLMKAEYFSKLEDTFAIEFDIVPRNPEDKGEETTGPTITSQQLQDYINEKTKDIDVNEIKNNTELDNNKTGE